MSGPELCDPKIPWCAWGGTVRWLSAVHVHVLEHVRFTLCTIAHIARLPTCVTAVCKPVSFHSMHMEDNHTDDEDDLWVPVCVKAYDRHDRNTLYVEQTKKDGQDYATERSCLAKRSLTFETSEADANAKRNKVRNSINLSLWQTMLARDEIYKKAMHSEGMKSLISGEMNSEEYLFYFQQRADCVSSIDRVLGEFEDSWEDLANQQKMKVHFELNNMLVEYAMVYVDFWTAAHPRQDELLFDVRMVYAALRFSVKLFASSNVIVGREECQDKYGKSYKKEVVMVELLTRFLCAKLFNIQDQRQRNLLHWGELSVNALQQCTKYKTNPQKSNNDDYEIAQKMLQIRDTINTFELAIVNLLEWKTFVETPSTFHIFMTENHIDYFLPSEEIPTNFDLTNLVSSLCQMSVIHGNTVLYGASVSFFASLGAARELANLQAMPQELIKQMLDVFGGVMPPALLSEDMKLCKNALVVLFCTSYPHHGISQEYKKHLQHIHYQPQ